MYFRILPCLISIVLVQSKDPFTNSTLQSPCSNQTDCTGNQVCEDGFCFCAANYRDPNDTGQCVAYQCQTSADCHSNDLYRVCDNGKCVCDMRVYFPDERNGGKCSLAECNDQAYCFLNQTVCQKGRCQCAENYHYNTTLGDCAWFYCQTTLDCNYEGSVCADNGTCVCADGYKPDRFEYNLCKKVSKTFGKSCDRTVKCDWKEREVCVGGMCQCEADYRFSNDSGHCEPYMCQNSSDCQSYDEHRICAQGKCVCDQTSVQNDTDGNKCGLRSSIYGHHCSEDSDCSEAHQRCVDEQCLCRVDYQFDTDLQLCERVFCANTTVDVCSVAPDEQRDCDNSTGHCLCREGYHENESNGRKCVKDKKKRDYTWVYILVPTVFGAVIVGSFVWIVIRKWRSGNTPTNRSSLIGLDRIAKRH